MAETILIVDDEESVRRTFRDWLVASGLDVEILAVGDAESALLLANNQPLDLAILDWNLGTGSDGLRLLEDLVEFHPDLVAILVTGFAHQATPLEALRMGVRDYLDEGPLGFPVVDVAVTLTDGSYHTVDSSDMAFRQAGRLAMQEGMPKCTPLLLEPIMAVDIVVPSEANSRINGIISQRRGQILGFDGRDGWPAWDVIQAHIPASEMDSLIVDLRSATSGVGSFTARFDHLSELTGRHKDQVLAARKPAAA